MIHSRFLHYRYHAKLNDRAGTADVHRDEAPFHVLIERLQSRLLAAEHGERRVPELVERGSEAQAVGRRGVPRLL